MNGNGTRRRILKIARTLFATHGYERTTMRLIGTQCGITDAAIYHHFPSKRALFDALLAELPPGEKSPSYATPEALVDGLVASRLSWHSNPDALPLVLAWEFRGDRTSSARHTRYWAQYVLGISQALAAMGFSQPELRGEVIAHMVAGSTLDAALRFGPSYGEAALAGLYVDRMRQLVRLYLEPTLPAGLRSLHRMRAPLVPQAQLGQAAEEVEAAGDAVRLGGDRTRRESIVDAALTVFLARGFDAATMREIAAVSGITDAAIYHYFPSKHGLFETVLIERGQTRPLEEKPAWDAYRGVDRLAAALETVLRSMAQHGELYRLVTREASRSSTALDTRNRRWFLYHDYLEAQIDERFTPGEACLFAASLGRLAQGIALRSQLSREDGLALDLDDPGFIAHLRRLVEIAAPTEQIAAARPAAIA